MTLVCDIGPTIWSAAGNNKVSSCAQGSVTIAPGTYIVAYTGNATTATIYGNEAPLPFSAAITSATSTGGQLPSSATTPTAGNFTYGGELPAIGLH